MEPEWRQKNKGMFLFALLFFVVFFIWIPAFAGMTVLTRVCSAQAELPEPGLHINDMEYFERPGLSVLVFHNAYPKGRQGGIEIIHHEQRIATNGDVRSIILDKDSVSEESMPKAGKRVVDKKKQEISVKCTFNEIDLNYTIKVRAEGDAFRIIVDLEKPLVSQWVGKSGFQLELYPGALFGKSFHLGDKFGVFPRQANGPMIPDEDGELQAVALATGRKLSIAPEEPLRRMSIESVNGEIALYDGRNGTNHKWFIVRSAIPPGATKGAIEWIVRPHLIAGWKRKPVICNSQVGYHPDQIKRAIIELDPRDKQLERAVLERVDPAGQLQEVLSKRPERWGRFLRYDYAIFDFTSVRQPGMYMLRYRNQTTPPFRISRDVYQHNVWQPTLETYLPIQMCHVEVRDRIRLWHGACHLDDAIAAPSPHFQFDGYRQCKQSGTSYAPFTHVPGLNRGGWHDAGDYDLATGSHAKTTFALALAREEFDVNTDQTLVNWDKRLVQLHTPDGVPDIIQQIENGVEMLLAGYRISGHAFIGIIAGSWAQYIQLGDASTSTDNLVYDSCLPPDSVVANRSDKRDDRWVFTSRDSSREYHVATVLAAASRVLRGYRDALADECLKTAVEVWKYEQSSAAVTCLSAYSSGAVEVQQILATVELLITTRDEIYRQRLLELLPAIEENIIKTPIFDERISRVGWSAARAIPYVNDSNFTSRIRQAIEVYKKNLDKVLAENPFGVPFHPHIWGIGWSIQLYAMEQYYLIQAYPDLFEREYVLRVLNYILGSHPVSNTSLVSGVGAHSLTSVFVANRADWSYIPGAGLSGPALIRPDFLELKEPFPFIWQQSENVIRGAATYLFCVQAADHLLNKKESKH